jgi:protein-ribulosamine 3-kinase
LDFHDIEDEMPHTSELVAVIAKLHQETSSPNGKFGFHVGVYGGCQPIDTSWTDTWEEFFTRIFKNSLKGEKAIQGHDDEMTELGEAMIGKVIPRLLAPMESGGRSLKPCLLHGDLWHGNVGIDLATDEPMLYDFCSFYGHNECRHCRLMC